MMGSKLSKPGSSDPKSSVQNKEIGITMEQRDNPEHPGNVRTIEEAPSTPEMEFCGAHQRF